MNSKMPKTLLNNAQFLHSNKKEHRCYQYVLKHATRNDPRSLCNAVDTFCVEQKQNWMMNLGPEKGTLVDAVIKKRAPKTLLELGTYVGYSSVRFSQFLGDNGKLVTIDVNPETTQLAQLMAEFAGVTCIEHRLGGLSANLDSLKARFPGGFDMVFLDHMKKLYVSDLKLLEKTGLVREGTCVISDNLVYPGCPEMFEYMKGNAHYSTQYIDSTLEYSDIKDTFGVSDCVKSFQ